MTGGKMIEVNNGNLEQAIEKLKGMGKVKEFVHHSNFHPKSNKRKHAKAKARKNSSGKRY